MSPRDQQALIARYQEAGHALYGHMQTCEGMTAAYGLAYLGECLADDIAAELRLRDAFDDAAEALLKELEVAEVLFHGRGYYKVGGLGLPCFYPGAPTEAQAS